MAADDILDVLREEPPAYGAASKPSPILTYLRKVEAARAQGNDTEHTHRPALKALLEALDPRIVATNEPKRIECGAPDLVITRKKDKLLQGHVEAKDIGVSLSEAKKSEQMKRYLPALSNLLLTDYLDFRWFVNGAEKDRFCLAEVKRNEEFVHDTSAFAHAEKVLKEFLSRDPVRIEGAEDLARRLAQLAHLIRDSIALAFQTGNASEVLKDWRAVFAQTLLPELADEGKEAEFADMFAQTLAYGLFSARVMSASSRQFTLAEAAKLIPKTNPFLRDFFDLITGPKLDDEPFIGYVQDIVTILECANMALILEDFGRGVESGRRRDPVIHFYETFLKAYDPVLKDLRGVYYTPEPVVSYIVESIDWLLREKFGLKDGLADKAKFTFTRKDGDKEIEEESHRVLVLDPATGTGTFLFEVIEQIRERFEKKHQAGLWPAYVHEHLLPRLFGFELLMAPYAVAHFKIGLELSGRHLLELQRDIWAYHFQGDERVNIFLTNTLEDIQQITAQQGPLAIIGKEGNEAIAIKKHRPVLVVLGNPPYANFGRQNRNDFILGLLEDYKRGLKEKKINLNNDFIKFVRWAHWRIEQTGCGIIGYIIPHVFVDGLTHRRMRESLLETFDEIYILDLHGSTEPLQPCPDGSKDDNVFDIKKGVTIALFAKMPPDKTASHKDAKAKKKHATVHHADLWGLRKNKYDWLNVHNATNTEWTTFQPDAPDFRFVPRNAKHEKEWKKGWSIHDIFPISNNGLKTDRDELFFDFDRKELEKRMMTFFSKEPPSSFLQQYRVEDSSSYDIETRRRERKFSKQAIQRCLYRPFDFRWLYYDVGLTSRPAEKVMKHFTAGENIGFITTRQTKDQFGVLASTLIAGHKSCAAYDINTVFPLYLYPNGESEEQVELVPHENGRRPNLADEFVKQFAEMVGLKFIADGRGDLKKTFGPEDIFHYAYAIFHSQSYRSRYIEFLKLDFPRVPFCYDQQLFRKLCGCGAKLVALHTLQGDFESQVDFDTPGSNIVEQIDFVPANKEAGIRRDRVQINSDQYFEGISPAVWQMRIGGYQVCEKWLKDRKGRALTHDEIEHYQRTVSALAETRTLMAQIDSLISDHGGWPLE